MTLVGSGWGALTSVTGALLLSVVAENLYEAEVPGDGHRSPRGTYSRLIRPGRPD